MQVHNRKRAVIFALLAAAWIGVLFFFSGQSGSDSGALSMALARFLLGKLTHLGIDVQRLNFLLRKAAHFSIFAVEGFLVGMALLSLWKKRRAIPLATLLCALLAVTNELHQRLSEGRACSSTDMLIDFAGGMTGLVVAVVILHAFSVSHRRKAKITNTTGEAI